MTEVEWERPGDEQLTWERDELHIPDALTPLAYALLGHVAQGMTRGASVTGRTMAARVLRYAGHPYWAMILGPEVPREEQQRIRLAEQQTLVERWEREWLPEIQRNLARHRAYAVDQLSDQELADAFQDVMAVQTRHWHIHFMVVNLAHSTVKRLVDWYLKRFPGAPETEPYKLLQGEPNVSVRSGHQLWRLSRMVTPQVAEALRRGDRDGLPEPFRQAFEAYLDEYGRRPQRLLDPGSPTWQEEPASVVHVILGYAESGGEDPLVESERLAAEREAFTAQVEERLAPEERPEFAELLALVRSVSPLTEDHAYWIDQQSVAAFRRVCVEFGRRLAAHSLLEAASDFVFVTPSEMLEWGFGLTQPGLRSRVAARKREYEAHRAGTPPLTLGAPRPPAQAAEAEAEAEPGQLRGIGASAGVIRGKARVVRSLDEAVALQPGEILVCRATDPNWTPLFGIAAALITDMGGSLCHAAVVAREYRLPAVVGARTATATIQTGQEVEVDGTAGVIRFL